MITWVQVWPLLCLPTVLLGLVGLLPTIHTASRVLGGGPLREWVINHGLLPWLPYGAAGRVVEWFDQATVAHEWLLYMLVVLNLNALFLPVLYGLGEGWLRVRNWFARKDLELKRRAARR